MSVGPKTLLRNFFATRRTKTPTTRFGWLGRRMHNANLWHFGRRSVAGGVGVGLFLSFIPIPIQMLLAVPCAIVLRINLPVTFTAIWATNPITFAPMFIGAFKVGSWITGYDNGTSGVPFTATFDGLAATFGVIWYPLLVGCFVCGISAGTIGYLLVHGLWRIHLVGLRRKRFQRTRE
ncbi:MAG: hypothetical protein ACI9BW_002735 [Gammaproteobacteria bacterium]|jgi:uncharacterized protein (DUF2062 family)